jgi:predicted nucleotidyltransferase
MLTTKDILNYLLANKSNFRQKYFVDKIAIVGSYARGDYNNDSDIDLLGFLEFTSIYRRISPLI